VGADAYLTKPFDPNEMIRVVRELASATPSR
jgi:DNA-binding response OmpR family regulator